MAFTEDLSAFFSTADFAVSGTLAGSSVTGIYEQPAGVELGSITAAGPVFRLPTSEVPAAWFNATLSIPQGEFKAREHYPDGTGVSVILLTRVS